MKISFLFVFYLFRLNLCQEVNPVPSSLIFTVPFRSVTLYRDQLFGTASVNFRLFQIDLLTDKQVQNRSFIYSDISNTNALKAFNGSLFVSAFINYITYFDKFSLSGIQSNYLETTVPFEINAFEFLNDFVFVGSLTGIGKYRIDTLQLIESVSMEISFDLSIYQQKTIISGGQLIQQRNCSNLTHLIMNYNYGPQSFSTETNAIAIQNQSLFTAHQDGSINQWNIATGVLSHKFLNHTGGILCLKIYENFIFSGSVDYYWIQWDIATRQVIRKVNTNNYVYNLVIFSPFLYVASPFGLLKYLIPELGVPSITSLAITDYASVVATLQSSQETQSNSKYYIIDSIQEVTTLEATIKAHYTSELLFENETFLMSSTTSKSKLPLMLSTNYNPFFSLFYLIVVIICSLVFLFGISLFIYYLRTRNKKKNQNLTNDTTTTTTTTATISATSNNNTNMTSSFISSSTSTDSSKQTLTNSFTGTESTLINTFNAYSIPGHLQLKKEEIRMIKQIAKGGQGIIFLGEILNQEYIRKNGKHPVIVKSKG